MENGRLRNSKGTHIWITFPDIGTIAEWLLELKGEACIVGRFPKTRRAPFWFDTRYQCQRMEGWKPFRCLAYNKLVRRIHVLDRILADMIRKRRISQKRLHQKPQEARSQTDEG